MAASANASGVAGGPRRRRKTVIVDGSTPQVHLYRGFWFNSENALPVRTGPTFSAGPRSGRLSQTVWAVFWMSAASINPPQIGAPFTVSTG